MTGACRPRIDGEKSNEPPIRNETGPGFVRVANHDRWRTLGLAATCVVGALVCGGCGSSSRSAASCLSGPQTIPQRQLLSSGATLLAPVGRVIFAVMVEDEQSASAAGSFPWVAPRSSDRRVLAPVRVCPRHGASTLAVNVAGFRATAPPPLDGHRSP